MLRTSLVEFEVDEEGEEVVVVVVRVGAVVVVVDLVEVVEVVDDLRGGASVNAIADGSVASSPLLLPPPPRGASRILGGIPAPG